MATAGTVTLSTAEQTFYEDSAGATSVYVKALAANAQVRVPGLHAVGEWFPLPSEEPLVFTLQENGIRKILGKSSTGTPSIEFGAVAKVTTNT